MRVQRRPPISVLPTTEFKQPTLCPVVSDKMSIPQIHSKRTYAPICNLINFTNQFPNLCGFLMFSRLVPGFVDLYFVERTGSEARWLLGSHRESSYVS